MAKTTTTLQTKEAVIIKKYIENGKIIAEYSNGYTIISSFTAGGKKAVDCLNDLIEVKGSRDTGSPA